MPDADRQRQMKFVLRDSSVRTRAKAAIDAAQGLCEVVIRPYKESRTSQQNALLWSLLTEIAEQVEWHGQRLSKEDWKDMLSAALKRQMVVPGIEGGFVVLGARTSKMSVAEMTEMIEFCYAFGAEHGVRFLEAA